MTDEELRELLARAFDPLIFDGPKGYPELDDRREQVLTGVGRQLAALREKGLAVVPVEASIDMIQAGQGWHGLQQAWADMIEAGRVDR